VNGFLAGLGIYLVLGIMFIGARWKRISAIGRSFVGDRVNLAIPLLVLIWPFIAIEWIADEVKVLLAVRRANNTVPRCSCGAVLRLTALQIRALRDEGHSELKCDRCGAITKLSPQRT
jgi:hypothetical protein